MVLEKSLESPLDCREIQPVRLKGNQSWVFIGRTDAEAETPILWTPEAKNWLTGKYPDAGKDWRQEEKGMTAWDGWMASRTQWTWVWANSRSWQRTGKPGMLQSMGSQRVGHNLMTEQQQCPSRDQASWAIKLGQLKQEILSEMRFKKISFQCLSSTPTGNLYHLRGQLTSQFHPG